MDEAKQLTQALIESAKQNGMEITEEKNRQAEEFIFQLSLGEEMD